MWRILISACVVVACSGVVGGSSTPGLCEDVKFPCVPKSLYPNANNCSTYFKCAKSKTKLRLQSCPVGEEFDVDFKSCYSAGSATCQRPCVKSKSVVNSNMPSEDSVSLREAPLETDNATSAKVQPTEDLAGRDEFKLTTEKEVIPKADADKNEATGELSSSSTKETAKTGVVTSKLVTDVSKEPSSSIKSTTMAPTTTSTTTLVPTTTTTTTTTTTPTTPTTITSTETSTIGQPKSSLKPTTQKTISYIPPKNRPSKSPGDAGVTVTLNLTATEKASASSGRRMDSTAGGGQQLPVGIIVGAVAGVLVVIAVVVAVIIICRKKRRKLSNNEITKIENPQYRGPGSQAGNGSTGPSLIVRNYRFSRDFDLYEGSSALSNSNNSISRSEVRSKKRRAPPPPNPFGDTDADDQQPMVEMTTFMEKPPPKPPRQNSLNRSASSGDAQNFLPKPDDPHVNAGVSEPLLNNNETIVSAHAQSEHDVTRDANETDNTYLRDAGGDNVSEGNIDWDEYDRIHNPFAS